MQVKRLVPLFNIHDGAGDPAAVRAQGEMDGLAPDGSQLHKPVESDKLTAKTGSALFRSGLET